MSPVVRIAFSKITVVLCFQMIMIKTLFLAAFCSCLFGNVISQSGFVKQSGFAPKGYPLQIIFDTDFGPDYDDVGAITILHAFADSGWVRILATIASSKHKNIAAAINVFNTYFNRPGIPIGVVSGPAVALSDHQHWTDTVIRRYPHKIKSNAEVPDAMILYRKILASQPDHSVTIITVGFLTNLANLLNSGPDSISVMNGYELVKNKVSNLVCMGGRFPKGNEFNLAQDVPATRKVLEDWPTNILFSGFEIGQKIHTGLPLVQDTHIRNSPVKDVFSLCIPLAKEDSAGRMSWDETAVLVAIRGWQPYYNIETGNCSILNDGTNEWNPGGNHQARLIEKVSPAIVQEQINRLIKQQPVKRPSLH
jgi:pyrimidine-specific ribonucleoside hydrolase